MWYSKSHKDADPSSAEAPVNFSDSNRPAAKTAAPSGEVDAAKSAEAAATAAAHQAAESQASANLNAAEKKQSEILDQILASKNDNDPRMDKDLRHLSENFKNYLTQKYRALAPEKRNDKGTVVFLIGRELSTPEDVQFLREVFTEQPCLSLANCQALPESRDAHHASEEEVSLVYPQMVALYQLEDQLKKNPKIAKDPNMRPQLIQTLEQAKSFAVPRIREKAEQIQQTYGL